MRPRLRSMLILRSSCTPRLLAKQQYRDVPSAPTGKAFAISAASPRGGYALDVVGSLTHTLRLVTMRSSVKDTFVTSRRTRFVRGMSQRLLYLLRGKGGFSS